jgi:S-adenosylmethionine:tRNA ribosyltransferase-isomerase
MSTIFYQGYSKVIHNPHPPPVSSLVSSPFAKDLPHRMRTADFDFEVPPELVAQTPAVQRDGSRLLVLHRDSGKFEHRLFVDLLHYLRPGDVLVLNDSRVIPARLRGLNTKTSGQFEVLLVEEVGLNDWWVMLRPGKRAREGTRIAFRDSKGAPTSIEATVVEKNEEGHRRLRFGGVPNILDALDWIGESPLPPYIERDSALEKRQDRERYQTVFAHAAGSVAAPTAGLHFTEALLSQVSKMGVQVCFVTLHVGLGTFAPVKSESLASHLMHEERYDLSKQTADAVNHAKACGGRVIAVGTTTLRVLETLASEGADALAPGEGRTRIFIYPPYHFKIVDVLLTNFHLPRSTLVMLVSAFAAPGRNTGRQTILSAYGEAARERYRFFSYGDAMLII